MSSIHKFWPILLTFVVLSACGRAGLNTDMPEQASQIDGWNGFQLVKGVRCEECYDVVIPERFGLKEDELDALIDLNNALTDMQYDLDAPLYLQEDTLEHLKLLAIMYKNQKAAEVLLFPEEAGMELGADTSEQLDTKYIIPMLEQYADLNSILTPDHYEDFADHMCISLGIERDFTLFDKVAARLSQDNPELLNKLEASCSLEKLDLKKNDVPFKDTRW